MRDVDRAWSEGSRDIEIEANRDAMPGPGEYVCFYCLGTFDFDDDPVTYEDRFTQSASGYDSGFVLVCPECAGVESEVGS